jgi:ATP-dependent DNA helicase RecG
MPSILPINVEDLLRGQGVESARLELKASWSDPTGAQVIRTICAFANDLQNLNGGYIAIGVAEKGGAAELPPQGLRPDSLDAIQRWIRGNCKRIEPEYQPVLSPEVVDGRHVLIVWAPGSDTRPHRAPQSNDKDADREYYIRLGSETVAARDENLRTLMQLTARVPFDDRRAMGVPVEKIRETKVKEFLSDVRSALVDEKDTRSIYRRMFIVSPVNGHETPRNVGLMFFSDDPEEWFRGARIEVVHFAEGTGGDVLEERTFRGPLHTQLRDCINYLRNLSTRHIEKQVDRPETQGWVSYPLAAMEEALVNAVYHRSYEEAAEPVKVYLHPDRMEIISYPGPVPGINSEHLQPRARIPPVPARNRRIGEFLKELRLAEGRGTGVPKLFKAMRENGSPLPTLDFDDARSYFRVTLPAHPEYRAVSALRDVAQLRALGRQDAATKRLLEAFEQDPGCGTLAAALIEAHAKKRNLKAIVDVYRAFFSRSPTNHEWEVERALGAALDEVSRDSDPAEDDLLLSISILEESTARLSQSADETQRRTQTLRTVQQGLSSRKPELIHELLDGRNEMVLQRPSLLLWLAWAKSELAKISAVDAQDDRFDDEARRRLWRGARDLLRRVIQMDATTAQHRRAWDLLAKTLEALEAPESEIAAAQKEAEASDDAT